jgi:hypothetical protein
MLDSNHPPAKAGGLNVRLKPLTFLPQNYHHSPNEPHDDQYKT